MYRGYIKLWRRIQDNAIWVEEKFTRGQAWVDLLLLANHKTRTIRIRGCPIIINRGQLAYSQVSLAKRWKWSRGKVRRFLSELSKNPAQQIVQQSSNVTSIISIINYDQYQEQDSKQDTKQYSKRYTNNNVKNVKNKYREKFSNDEPPKYRDATDVLK